MTKKERATLAEKLQIAEDLIAFARQSLEDEERFKTPLTQVEAALSDLDEAETLVSHVLGKLEDEEDELSEGKNGAGASFYAPEEDT